MNTSQQDAIGNLLNMLRRDGFESYHSALAALVADRDKLSSQVCGLRIAMKAQDDRDRELRERLVCAALTGLLANPMHHTQTTSVLSDAAILVADNTIAAMRKGER